MRSIPYQSRLNPCSIHASVKSSQDQKVMKNWSIQLKYDVTSLGTFQCTLIMDRAWIDHRLNHFWKHLRVPKIIPYKVKIIKINVWTVPKLVRFNMFNQILPLSRLCLRMLGTFNQHLPMILSNNYWCQNKPTIRPTSLLGTGMGVIPWSVQQSMKNVIFADLHFLLKYIEILSCQNYLQKLTMAPHLGTAILFIKISLYKGVSIHNERSCSQAWCPITPEG